MSKILMAGFAIATLTAGTALAATDPTVGGAAMYPTKTIVENASAAPNLSTLVTAVKAAGLVDTLSGAGPFTVFAPTDKAFSMLPSGTVETLLKPENKAKLTSILTYHVVPGTLTGKDLRADVKRGGGTATLKTVEGEDLTITAPGGHLMLASPSGTKARITTANVTQSNGMVMVIDHVLTP